MWNWNLQGTNAIMRETRTASAKRRASAKGIFGFSSKVILPLDLVGGADCVTDSAAIVSPLFSFLPPISIFCHPRSIQHTLTWIPCLKHQTPLSLLLYFLFLGSIPWAIWIAFFFSLTKWRDSSLLVQKKKKYHPLFSFVNHTCSRKLQYCNIIESQLIK